MWPRALPVLLLGFLPQGVAAAQLTVSGDQPTAPVAAAISCLGRPVQGAMEARCAELAAASGLLPPPQPSDPSGLAGSIAPVGQGALIGLGVGLLTAAIFAHGCEENASRCTVFFIIGGSALGAGIGAAVGAVVGNSPAPGGP